jgi:D-alanyl-D-alanine carboxypeptidase
MDYQTENYMQQVARFLSRCVLALAPAIVAGLVSAEAYGAEDGTCVANIDKVVARKPTDAMTTVSLPEDLAAKLDAAAREGFAKASAPGAIVGVRTPEGTWKAAYGMADPKAGTPMQIGMHTRIGSVTKTFIGTVIMQLAEKGKLSLNDPIEKYVSGVPNGNKISLRQLADMTSGVASYTRSSKFTDAYFAKPETIYKPHELLAIGISESPLFAPGAQFDYSNTNTILLGMVIENVAGRPIDDVLKTMIFEPLKLKGTSWPGEKTEIPFPSAEGFTLQGVYAKPDAPSNATHWNPAWGWTAGELISNMDDLLTYDRALGTGQKLLSAASQSARLRSFPGAAGYGIAMGCVDGWVGHTGELPGYNTSVFYDTSRDTAVVVQTNSDIPSGNCPVSPVLTDDPRDIVCSSPATRIFVALSTALGHTFTPVPQK